MDNNNGKQHSYSQQAIEKHYGRFMGRVMARLEQGKRDYGDTSFHQTSPATIQEIQEELEDVNGWSFILWERLERMKQALARFESPNGHTATESAPGRP